MVRVVILGAGGHGREIAQALRGVEDIDFLGFLDDQEPEHSLLARIDAAWLGPLSGLARLPSDVRYLAGAGAGRVRRAMDLAAGGREPFTLVHPLSSVGADVELGPGVVVFPFATVTTNVRLGRHTHIGRGAAIGHDCSLGDFVSVYPLAAVSGNVSLDAGVTVGTTASIRQGQHVASDVTIGSGAAVVDDFPEGVTVVGVPAVVKERRRVDGNEAPEAGNGPGPSAGPVELAGSARSGSGGPDGRDARRRGGPVPVGDVRVVPETEWDALVARLGGLDSYTRAAYHRASALVEPAGTVPVLLHYARDDGGIALPLLLKTLPDGSGCDASSAYGYGGPVAASKHGVEAFGKALDAWARENGVVTTFLRLHPLLRNARLLPPTAERVHLGPTVAWDVSPGRDLPALMHAHHRRAARKADLAGLEVRIVPRPVALEEFRELYDVTMRRLQADPFFFFGAEYWDALIADGEELGLVLVEGRLGGELATALLCMSEGPWLHYHLGASSDAARSIGASNRCFLAAAQWAQSLGKTRFHLGGGLGSNATSSLYQFKSRFDPGSVPLPFGVAKLVHDSERYRQLAGTDSTAGFFPPWRRAIDRRPVPLAPDSQPARST